MRAVFGSPPKFSIKPAPQSPLSPLDLGALSDLKTFRIESPIDEHQPFHSGQAPSTIIHQLLADPDLIKNKNWTIHVLEEQRRNDAKAYKQTVAAFMNKKLEESYPLKIRPLVFFKPDKTDIISPRQTRQKLYRLGVSCTTAWRYSTMLHSFSWLQGHGFSIQMARLSKDEKQTSQEFSYIHLSEKINFMMGFDKKKNNKEKGYLDAHDLKIYSHARNALLPATQWKDFFCKKFSEYIYDPDLFLALHLCGGELTRTDLENFYLGGFFFSFLTCEDLVNHLVTFSKQ